MVNLLARTGSYGVSLSGCGGSSSNSFVDDEETAKVSEVAVIESPVFEQGHSYRIIEGATLSGMNGAKYFVADVGSEGSASVLNLGFTDKLGNQTLVFVDDATGKVVFAYDPSGSDGSNKTSGTVNYSGGTRMKYTSLVIPADSMFSAMNVDTSSAKIIVLNGDSATIDGSAVPTYDYVWHFDPDHADEYYTLGLNGTEELDEDAVEEAISDQTVYIARDVHYMTSDLEFTGTAKNDEETEYAAYYSASVSADVASSKYPTSPDLWGPYIFATLPQTMGGMGGGTPPDMNGMTPAQTFSASESYNSQIASTIALMTHSSEDAYANPVLHICKAGVYQLQGTWNGQIWIDVGEDSSDKVAIILNGVDVTCSVAPAIVFHDLYECGPDDEDEVASRMAASSSDIGYSVLDDAGAMVIIADDTTNNFTGANVYRMLKPQIKKTSVTKIDGTDVDQQKKRWKTDGAFYSFVSLAIGGGSKQNGVLNITSTTYEGLNSELHMTLESGVVSVTAPDDGINVNEDNTSVFTMIDGKLTISSSGGDGVDSNGWIVILGGSLDVTAAQDSNTLNAGAEGPLDADMGVYMDTSNVNYTHRASSGNSGGVPTTPGAMSGDVPSTPPDGISPDVAPSIPSNSITTNTTTSTNLSSNSSLLTQLMSALGVPAGTSLIDNSTLTVSAQSTVATAQTALRALTSVFRNAASAVVAFVLPAISSPTSGVAVIALQEADIAPYRGSVMSFVMIPKSSASASGFRASAATDVHLGKFLKADGTVITGAIPSSGDIVVSAFMDANVTYDPMVVSGTLTPASSNTGGNSGGSTTTTTPATTTEPEPQPEPETPSTTTEPESDVLDYTSDSISSSSGVTTFSLGLSGSSMTIRSDPDAATPRGISSSSNVFQITRSVNTFSGITPDN